MLLFQGVKPRVFPCSSNYVQLLFSFALSNCVIVALGVILWYVLSLNVLKLVVVGTVNKGTVVELISFLESTEGMMIIGSSSSSLMMQSQSCSWHLGHFSSMSDLIAFLNFCNKKSSVSQVFCNFMKCKWEREDQNNSVSTIK